MDSTLGNLLLMRNWYLFIKLGVFRLLTIKLLALEVLKIYEQNDKNELI